MNAFSSTDPVLLGSLAGLGLFFGLCTVLGIVLIFRRPAKQPGNAASPGEPDAGVETPAPAILDRTSGYSGQLRGALSVLIAGVLILAIGLPVALVILPQTLLPAKVAPPDDIPQASPVPSPPPEATTPDPEKPPETTVPVAGKPSAPDPEQPAPDPIPGLEPPPPTSPPEPPPSNVLLQNLTFTPDPESGYNWFKISVNLVNPGENPETVVLHSKVADRLVTPHTMVVAAGENKTHSLEQLSRELGFLAVLYEKGIIAGNRQKVTVNNLTETLTFGPPARLKQSETDKMETLDWETLESSLALLSVTNIPETPAVYVYRWEITLRGNEPPARVFRITIKLFDNDGDMLTESVIEDNELEVWETRSLRGVITLTEEQVNKLASHRIEALCTAGCGEDP